MRLKTTQPILYQMPGGGMNRGGSPMYGGEEATPFPAMPDNATKVDSQPPSRWDCFNLKKLGVQTLFTSNYEDLHTFFACPHSMFGDPLSEL